MKKLAPVMAWLASKRESLLVGVDRPELEQFGLRVTIAAAVMFYLFWYSLSDDAQRREQPHAAHPEDDEVGHAQCTLELLAVTGGGDFTHSFVPQRLQPCLGFGERGIRAERATGRECGIRGSRAERFACGRHQLRV